MDTPLLQATFIATEINCIKRCKLYSAIALFLAAIIRGGSRSEKPLTQKLVDVGVAM